MSQYKLAFELAQAAYYIFQDCVVSKSMQLQPALWENS
jgi:hypothetical protein